MKKRKYLFIVLATLIIVITIWMCIEIYSIREFSLPEYQRFLEEFPGEEVVGPVKDAKTARQVAFELWCDVYGKEKIEDEKPYTVYYDKANDVWLVCGSKPMFTLGGTAQVIIRASDGQVLALWHSK